MINLDDARPGMRVRCLSRWGNDIQPGSLATVDDPPVITNSSGSFLRVIWDGGGFDGGYYDHMFEWVGGFPVPEPLVEDNDVKEIWY